MILKADGILARHNIHCRASGLVLIAELIIDRWAPYHQGGSKVTLSPIASYF
jgi:hypothetical protein